MTQLAVNDVFLLVVDSPVVKLLSGSSNIQMPWSTLFASVGFFVAVVRLYFFIHLIDHVLSIFISHLCWV